MSDTNESHAAEQGAVAGPYNTPLAYLRAFIIVLVIAHHAMMAYHVILPAFAPSSLSEYLQSIQAISPVNDAQRSGLLSLLAAFNDSFFMPLLFLLSGLFVWNSLQRKGRVVYLRERLLRLGVPIVLMAVLRPLTYYPTYLQNGGAGGLADFWQQWSSIGWRGGPIWFLEVLLIFDFVLVLVASAKLGFGGREENVVARRPLRFLGLLLLCSAVAYVPITGAYGSFFWVQWGPAQVQVNRVLFYAVYFLAGVFFGAYGIERTFLTPDSPLARRWGVWAVAGLTVFAFSTGVVLGGAGEMLASLLFVLACAVLSVAFLAVFLRFAQTPRGVFDSLFENSYGIYVFHYGVVAWVSYALLDADLSAAAKWLIVFPSTLAICWAATALLRRIPGVSRVL